jgi:hypothetical protein
MSAINVNSITGRTGSHGPVLTGVTTISGDLHVGSGLSVTGISTLSNTIVGGGLSVTGISTLSNTVVGGATTELVVGGDARITGILTIGTGSVTIDGTSGSSSITGVTTAGIGSVYGVDSINDLGFPTGGALSNRNIIINGSMQFAQRSISVNNITSTDAYLTVDRYRQFINTLGTWTVERHASGPPGFDYSYRATCTSGNASPAAGSYAFIRYGVEKQDMQILAWVTT